MHSNSAADMDSPSGSLASTLPDDGASSAGCKKRVGKELGPGDRAEQIQVSCGNGFFCDVTLVSTPNKKYRFPPGLPFSLLLLSSFAWLQALSLHGLSEATMLKR